MSHDKQSNLLTENCNEITAGIIADIMNIEIAHKMLS